MSITQTIGEVRFTDYTIEDLRKEARHLAKSKQFGNGKGAKLQSFVLRVTNNGARIVAKVSGNDGETERGTTL